jgi:hypothetical protein
LVKVVGDAGEFSRDTLIVLGIFARGNRPQRCGSRSEFFGEGSSFHGGDPPSVVHPASTRSRERLDRNKAPIAGHAC